MNGDKRGQLVLKSIPRGDRGRAVIDYLTNVFNKAPREKIARLVENSPVVLHRKIPETAGKRILRNLERLGAAARFDPGPERETDPSMQRKQDARNRVLAALSGKVPEDKPSFFYILGLCMVMAAMFVPPLVYAGLIGLAGWAVYWHIVENITLFSTIGRMSLAIPVYLAPILVGGVVILFMVKPFLARRGEGGRPWRVDPESQPLLHEFVRKLAEMVGAPEPREIVVDMEVNAHASFRRGFSGLFRKELVLTFGMPLAAGLRIEQFAGVLAHELGHFSQTAGMRLTYLIRTVHCWFHRVVYEEDHWDERIRRWSREVDLRLALPLLIARAGIWLTRKILWLVMTPGRAIGCFTLRQMEYDADRCEIFVAGSIMFNGVTRSMIDLSMARDWAWEDFLKGGFGKRLERWTIRSPMARRG